MASDFKPTGPNSFFSPTLGHIQKRAVGKKKEGFKYFCHPEPAPVEPWKWFGPYPTAKEAELALEKGEFSL